MDARPTINGLPLPERLVALVTVGRWVHPGDERLRALIPFLTDTVVFLSLESMGGESSLAWADDPAMAATFRIAHGSRAAEPVELPWLDADRAILVAVNRHPGDDVAISLDFRTDADDPRVVASDWGNCNCCQWREVTPTFSEFVRRLGLEATT